MNSDIKQNIVICGYPKSGNTWVTRLVAELVHCPVAGFWQSSHNEIALEGTERDSSFACYKSHHQLYKLQTPEHHPWKIIYVIRDPRDIVFSGMKYFFPGYRARKESKLKRTLIPDFISYSFGGSEMIKQAMIQAVLYGNRSVHTWYHISWKQHVLPFLEHTEVFKVRYTDLLESPESLSREMLNFLSIERTSSEIQKAVSAQSFDAVRSKFRKQGNRSKSGFLRKGQTGYWRDQLTHEEKQLFDHALGDMLVRLGYPRYIEQTGICAT